MNTLPPFQRSLSPTDRLDSVRCLLLKIWQGYDAAGHSNGRSLTCGALEAAMHLLAPPRPEARRNMECADLIQLIHQAEEQIRADRKAADDLWFKHLDSGDAIAVRDKYVERLRAEIESGFENRMR